MAFYLVIERVLELWDALEKYFLVQEQVKSIQFPLIEDKKALEECREILKVIHEICVDSQASSIGTAARVMKHICDLVSGQSDERRIWDLDQRKCLTPIAQQLLNTLKVELKVRFFDLIFCEDPLYLGYLIQLYLHPRHRSLSILQKTCQKLGNIGDAFNTVKRKIRGKVREIGLKIESQVAAAQHNPSAFSCVSAASDFSDVSIYGDQSQSGIDSELKKYENIDLHNVAPSWKKAGIFWQNSIVEFPILSRVSFIFYGLQPSSGALERNFGTAGRLITKERTSLGDAFVDMSLFVQCNKEIVDLDQIREFSDDDLHRAMPKKIYRPVTVDRSLREEAEECDDENETVRKRTRLN